MKLKQNQRIKQLREYLGKTQQEFCYLCGITITSLSRIENDQALPSRKTLEKIAEKTGVKREWLLEGLGEFLVNPDLIQDYNKHVEVGNTWKEEAYQKLERQNSYLQDKLNEAMAIISGMVSGNNKRGDANFPTALDHNAAEGIIINLNELPFESRARA